MTVDQLIDQLKRMPNQQAPVTFFDCYDYVFQPDNGHPVTGLVYNNDGVKLTNETPD